MSRNFSSESLETHLLRLLTCRSQLGETSDSTGGRFVAFFRYESLDPVVCPLTSLNRNILFPCFLFSCIMDYVWSAIVRLVHYIFHLTV